MTTLDRPQGARQLTEAGELPEYPYKGLDAYSPGDAPFFFGRTRERRIISANLLASRLTLLYGASGVGKSSLLSAGVAFHIERTALGNVARRRKPGAAIAVVREWKDDPLREMTLRVVDAVQRVTGRRDTPATRPLAEVLDWAALEVDGPVLLILDQFEEFFAYHGAESGSGTFIAEFPRLIARSDLQAQFLISVREDAWSKLDCFKGSIPNLYDNYYRVAPLSREAAREAIVEPLGVWEAMGGEHAEIGRDLVEAILDDVPVGKQYFDENTGGEPVDIAAAALAPHGAIETPFLQLVMRKLWASAKPDVQTGARILYRGLLASEGGARAIIRDHVRGRMGGLSADEQDLAAKVFFPLVIAADSKIALSVADLATEARADSAKVGQLLAELARGDARIVRPTGVARDKPDQPRYERYELFHDALRSPIRDWRAWYTQTKARDRAAAQLKQKEEAALRELAAARKRLIWSLVFVAILLVFAATAGFFAVDSDTQRRAAEAARQAAEDARQAAVDKTIEADNARRDALTAQANLELQRNDLIQANREADAATAAAKVAQLDAEQQRNEAIVQSALAQRYNQIVHDQDRGVPHLKSVMRGHSGTVTGASFSPNGQRLATASADGTAAIWETNTGELLTRLEGHADAVTSVSFSPDGRYVLTGSDDGTARIWDPDAVDPVQMQVQLLKGAGGPITSAVYSPDGRQVVTSSTDKSVQLWKVGAGGSGSGSGSGPSLTLEHPAAVHAAMFTPDGISVVTVSSDGLARVWDARSGALQFELAGHDGAVVGEAISPDGAVLATEGNDGTGRLWSLANGRALIQPLQGLTGPVSALAFNPRGDLLVTEVREGDVNEACIWDMGGTCRVRLKGHSGAITSVAFNSAGDRVLTASEDGTARVWDASTGQVAVELRGGSDVVRAAAFDKSGDMVVTASADRTARVWSASTSTGLTVTPLRGHAGPVTALAYSRDGQLLLTTSSDNTAFVWSAQTGDAVARLRGHKDTINRAIFSPDGQFVLTASADKTARLWRTRTGAEVFVLKHPAAVWDTAFSPDGTRMATTSEDGSIIIWSTATGGQLLALRSGGSAVLSIAWSTAADTIVTGGGNGTATLWDLAALTPKALLLGHSQAIVSTMYSADGSRILTRSRDNTVRIWDPGGRSIATLRSLDTPVSAINDASISPDGTRVVTAHGDGRARVWASDTGKLLLTLAHAGPVLSVSFSADGLRLVTASADHTAAIWDAASGTQLEVLSGHRDAVNTAVFRPSGDEVATASVDATARLWDIPPSTGGSHD